MAAVVAMGLIASGCSRKEPLNANVTTPAMAVSTLVTAHTIYFTYPAREYLSAKKPNLVSVHDSEQDRKDFLRAQQDPSLWRQLDHKYHFDAVLLTGDPVDYHNLLEHLIETKDWTLTYLDHTSLIFQRAPAKGWSLPDLQTLQQKFANYSAPERVVFLTGLARQLLAIGQTALAKQQLDESLKLDNKNAESWTQMALYQSQTGKTPLAVEAIKKALEIDPKNKHILSTQAQIFYAAGKFSDALAVSEQLVKDSPDDLDVLFFHAKLAHAAAKYREEILTMQHMVDLLVKRSEPTARFRIYLAQAYARNGQGKEALGEFQKALDEGGLTDGQTNFINETMKLIKTKAGM